MSDAVRASVVRIVDAKGGTHGTGFLVSSDGVVVTCTHVAEAACKHGGIAVVFRFSEENAPRPAVLDEDLSLPADAADIAFLRLDDLPPADVAPAVLGSSMPRDAVLGDLKTYGFPFGKAPVDGLPGSIIVVGETRDAGSGLLLVESQEITGGFSGAPVWDGSDAVIGMVDSTVSKDERGRLGLNSLVRPIETLIEANPELRPSVPNPYLALDRFEAADADRYFGRAADADALVERLAASGFVVVVGESGCGKSSLVSAGLAKRLRRPVVGLADPRVVSFRHGEMPGIDPTSAAQEALRTLAGGATIFVVDELERLLLDDGIEIAVKRSFLHWLTGLPEQRGINVVTTLRRDCYPLILELGETEALIFDSHRLQLGQMSREDLEQVIRRPAESAHRHVEPALVAHLIDDVDERPGLLPLLGLTLWRLWEEDAHLGRLRLATYEHLAGGHPRRGIRGVIAMHADAVWSNLELQTREAARRLFLWLVLPVGEPARYVGATRPIDALGERDRELVRLLAQSRLLTLSDDPGIPSATVELAHDAVIRSWPAYREWADRSLRFLSWRKHELGPLQERWNRSDGDEDLLLPESALGRAREMADGFGSLLLESEQRYLDASVERVSRRHAAARRSVRRLWTTVAVLLLLVTASGVFLTIALREVHQEHRQRVEAEQQRRLAVSRERAARALGELDRDPPRALKLARAAAGAAQTTEAREALARALASPVSRVLDTIGPTSSIAFSGDGSILADANGGVQIWAPNRGSLLKQWTSKLQVSKVAISADGSTIFALGAKKAAFWHWQTKASPIVVSAPKSVTDGCRFAPDGSRVACYGYALDVWDVRSGHRVLHRSLRSSGLGLHRSVVSDDGTRFAVITGSRTVAIGSVRSGRDLRTFHTRRSRTLDTVQLDRRGRRLLTTDDGGQFLVFDADTGTRLGRRNWPQHTVRTADGSEDWSAIATLLSTGRDIVYTRDGGRSVRIWNVARNRTFKTAFDWQDVLVLRPPTATRISVPVDGVMPVAVSADGHMAAALGSRGLTLIDVRTGHRLMELPAPRDGTTVAYSPDGQTLVMTLQTKDVWVWKPGVKVLRSVPPFSANGYLSNGRYTALSDNALAVTSTVTGHTTYRSGPIPGLEQASPMLSGNGGHFEVADYASKQVVSLDPPARGIKVWRAKDDVEVTSGRGEAVTIDSTYKHAQVIEMATGRVLLDLRHRDKDDGYYQASFAAKARLVALGTEHGVEIWDVPKRKLLRRIRSTAFYFALRPDGREIALAEVPQLRVLNLASGSSKIVADDLPDDTLALDGVAYTGAGQVVVNGRRSNVNSVTFVTRPRVFDVPTGRQLLAPDYGLSLNLSPHRDFVVISDDAAPPVTLRCDQCGDWDQLVARADRRVGR